MLNAQTLVKLGQTIDSASDHMRVGDVYSFRNDRRRKISELVVSSQPRGQVQIYDTLSAKLLASYAISTQWKHTCSPVSIRYRGADGLSRRITYVSVQQSRQKILCWIENSGKGKTVTLSEKLLTYAWQSEPDERPIIWMGPCSWTGNGSALLTIHQNGRIRLLNESLCSEFWRSSIDIGDRQVHRVSMLSIENARKGLLKNREDLLARLQATDISDLLLMVLQHQPNGTNNGLAFTVNVLAFKPQGIDSRIASFELGIETILSIGLPQSSMLHDSSTVDFQFYRSGATLFGSSNNTVLAYSLTEASSRLKYSVILESPIQSFVPISSIALAISTKESTFILNLKYNSIVASTAFVEDRAIVSSKDTVQFLSYISSTGSLIAFKDHELVSYQSSASKPEAKNGLKRSRNDTLADALGRGLRVHTYGQAEPRKTQLPGIVGRLIKEYGLGESWNEQKKRLSIQAKEGNEDNFDEIAFGHLERQKYSGTLPQSEQAREVVYTVLGSLFRLVKARDPNEPEPVLKLRLIPPRTIGWLIDHGYFIRHHVEMALKRLGKLPISANLSECALVDAIVIIDPTLQSLLRLAASSASNMNVIEVVKSILLALQALQEARDIANSGMLLTNKQSVGSEMPGNGDEQLVASTSEPSPEPSPEPQADKVHDAHALMALCLSRLTTFSLPAVRSALKLILPQSFLLAFIDYLRLDLATGGWFSPYSDLQLSVEGDVSLSGSYLQVVALSLSAALDSLGTGAWLRFDEDITLSISHMKAEVSAALEGIEEAAYLQGILREVLLYAKSNPPLPPGTPLNSKRKRVSEWAIAADGMEMVKPITVGIGDGETNALPMGFKPIGSGMLGSQGRDGKNGEKTKRSLRDIGRLKSMQVGAYSFERIMI